LHSNPLPKGTNNLLSGKAMSYLVLAVLFFSLSFATVFIVHRYFSGGRFEIPSTLLSAPIMEGLAILLVLYYMSDGLRLYCVIRAMGLRIPFIYMMKLVFVNIFVSNITPLATGGGVAQVYLMNRKGIPIGEATAATSIRTILAALVMFTITPVILWLDPEQFQIFFHRKILYGITAVSLVYLVVFWIILYRIRIIKCLLFKILRLLRYMQLMSQKRFRRIFLRTSLEMDLFSSGFKRYFRGNRAWVCLSVLSTSIFLLLLFSFSIVLVRGLGYKAPVLTMLAFQLVVTFFMYFTPTPGAVGVAEGGYGLLFVQIVQKKDLTMLTLSWRFLTIYIGVVVGMFLLYREIFRKGRKDPS